jgi:transcriptional regulator with XRE-family HTH domain
MNNQIKKLREAHAITQEELASRVGTTFQQISRLENGERKLSQEWMVRIGKALGVHPYLLIDNSSFEMMTESQGSGEFVNIPEELAWLRFFREMTDGERIFAVKLLKSGFSKAD